MLQTSTSSIAQQCKHCHLPLRAQQQDFCCSGCETVFHILEERGWTDYYRLREAEGGRAVPFDLETDPAQTDYAYLNSDAYRRDHVSSDDAGVLQTVWFLDGIQCGACLWLIEKYVRSQPQVCDLEVRMGDGRTTLYFREGCDLEALAKGLDKLGYRVGLRAESDGGRDPELLRVGVCGALAGNMMLMSLPFYTGLEDGVYAQIFAWTGFVLATLIMGYGAKVFFYRSWTGLKHGFVDLDLPIAIGLASAYGLSTYALITQQPHHLYFDSIGMLVFLLLVGRHVAGMGLRKALAEGNRLLSDMPQLYQVLRDGAREWVAAEDLKRGDRIMLRAGDVLPVDAQLEDAHASFNMHVVSGETHPVRFEKGDSLLAGAVNLAGKITVIAAADHRESKFERFKQMAEGLRDQRSLPKQKKLALVFVAAVSLCAAIGFYLWVDHSVFQGMATALTIFIVACPCALALAEPVSQAFVLGKAARAGIWVKQRRVFDCLPEIQEVVFDKTGVLTQGEPRVTSESYMTDNRRHVQAVIVALEDAADHPLARALRAHFKAVEALEMSGVEVHAGRGVSGQVHGQRYVICGPDGMTHFGISVEAQQQVAQWRAKMPALATHVLVFEDGAPVALFAIDDPLREEAHQLCQQLRGQGMQLAILSGDRQDIVSEMGQRLQISSAQGGLLPEEKLAYVTRAQQGPILMVGDGLNDMGALAAAHVGITHGNASGAALNFADVVLGKPSLDRIGTLFALVRAGKQANRRAVAISLAYNLTAISLAWAGLIGPLTAAILMPLSSLSVVAVTAWSLRRRKVNSWVS